MPLSKGFDVVLQRSLVLEVGATDAVPQFSTVLFMGSPISFHCEGLSALPAHERLDAVLPFVVSLEGPEVLQWLRSWMVYVVPAARRAAVARKPQHGRRLDAS